MRQFLLIAALLVALFSSGFSSVRSASAASPRANLIDAVMDEALAAHNMVRQRVALAESQRLGGTVSIPDLSWDSDLAALAQDWANQVVGLNPTPHRPADQRPGIGENTYMAYSIGAPVDQAPAAALQFWAGEQQYYDYDTNSCAAGQQCGHYTQLVWSTTTHVGCGQAVSNANGAEYVVWVCNYSPAGNLTINGEKLRPYSISDAPLPGAGCAYAWTRMLAIGSQGADVAELQRRLNAAGANLDADGIFGPLTDQAVRAFQAANQLAADGIVGPLTQAVLDRVCPAQAAGCAYAWTRMLAIGSQGADVAELQRRLNAAGANLDADGIFGPLTDQAVRAFQAANQLAADGIVGPLTQAVLDRVCPV